MPFPESAHVVYGKNPLEEVVVQLRFPPILRVLSEPPARFQDAVRADLPLYGRQLTAPLQLPAGFPPQLLQLMAGDNQPPHVFKSADEVWTLTLHRDFIALSTTKYTRWAEFRAWFTRPLAALREIYGPAFFTRVGLRYRDRIDRRLLGLETVSWSELLAEHVLGELGDARIGPHVQRMLREVVIGLANGEGRVRIVHGLEQSGQHYVIDSDFFTEGELETGAAENVLDSFNKRAGRLFRWCIAERLHNAMDPGPVGV